MGADIIGESRRTQQKTYHGLTPGLLCHLHDTITDTVVNVQPPPNPQLAEGIQVLGEDHGFYANTLVVPMSKSRLPWVIAGPLNAPVY